MSSNAPPRTSLPPFATRESHVIDEVTGRDLIARLRAGEMAALDLVLARYWSPLVAYLASVLHSRDAAEDIAQETFCRLWDRRTQLRVDGSLRGFLYQVAHNLAVSEQRRLRTRARSADLIRAQTPVIDDALEPPDDSLDAALDRAIHELPERRRQVLILRSVHGLSYKEIARALGIAPQTVGNQFSAALATLRRALSPFLT